MTKRRIGLKELIRSLWHADSYVRFSAGRPSISFEQLEDRLLLTTVPVQAAITGFADNWWISNVGQVVDGQAGTPGADISLENAWDITTGSKGVIVADLEDGVSYNNDELLPNLFENAVEDTARLAPVGDNDLDGFANDAHGWNFADGTNDPSNMPSGPNGTEAAGLIGAAGDATNPIIGVNWNVSIMPFKIGVLPNSNVYDDTELIEALDYIVMRKNVFDDNIVAVVVNLDQARLANTVAYNDLPLIQAINRVTSAGIIVVSGAGDGPSTAAFTPYPLADADIGAATPAGSATFAPTTGVYTVSGGGAAGIAGAADQLNFDSEPAVGDTTISTKVNTITNPNNTTPNAEAGVMIRQDNTAGSSFASITVNPTTAGNSTVNNTVTFQWRTPAGAGAQTVTIPASVVGQNGGTMWLKLVRTGDVFTGFYATTIDTPTAADWTAIGAAPDIPMADPVEVGLVASSRSATNLASATFDNLLINNSAVAPPPAPAQGIDIDTLPTLLQQANSSNIVLVAATDNQDNLWVGSNYGAKSVALAAPGVDIPVMAAGATTAALGLTDESSTNLAADLVAGVLALEKAAAPGASAGTLISALLRGTDPVLGLTGKVETGGRLDALKAVQDVIGDVAPKGATTLYTNSMITGYAEDFDSIPNPIQVELVVNGNVVATQTADGPSNGGYGFTFTNVPALEQPGALQTSIVAIDPLSGKGTTIKSEVLNIQNEIFVTHLYQDVLGRQPDPGGLYYWATQVAAGTPTIQIAEAFTHSTEYATNFVDGLYQNLLNEAPDPVNAPMYISQLENGATLESIEDSFLSSAQYFTLTGGTDQAWIGQLYQTLLGRVGSTSEINSWVNFLVTHTQQQLVNGFLYSHEYRTDQENAYYQQYLHRTGSSGEVASWVNTGLDQLSLQQAIFGSHEYFWR